AKSGKPCERFTAPCLSASRVISRITDSVKRLALRDTCRLLELAGVVITFLSQSSATACKLTVCVTDFWQISSQQFARLPALAHPSKSTSDSPEVVDTRVEFSVSSKCQRSFG